MVHQLKILKRYFKDIKNGTKKFEVRKNDRDYKVGDYLYLYLYGENLEGQEEGVLCKITYILDNEEYCKEGFVVMGIQLEKKEINKWLKTI